MENSGAFSKGHVPPNKKELSKEEEQYILENYRTTLNKDLAAKLGVAPKTMLRIFRRLGIKRTPEEAQAVSMLRKKPKLDFQSRRNIEGGGKKNGRAVWHKKIWTSKNGPIPEDSILVYSTKKYDSVEDLILIKKSKFDAFVKKRDSFLEKEKKRVEREKRAQKKAEQELKRSEREKQQEKHEEFIHKLRKNQSTNWVKEEYERGRVPIRLDQRTTVWVKIEKCDLLPNGNYVLKPEYEESYKNRSLSVKI